MYHQPMILKSSIAHAAEINLNKQRESQTKSNGGKRTVSICYNTSQERHERILPPLPPPSW